MKRAIAWIRRNTSGQILAEVEGTSSYGSSLTLAWTAQKVTVVELTQPRKKERAGVGKNDAIDATAATMGILAKDVTLLLQPRAGGARAALSVLLTSRHRL